MGKKKKFAGGIIGCGEISRAHINAFLKNSIECTGLCDIKPDSAERLKEEFKLKHVPVFKDYKEMLKLKNLDIVAVTTPPFLHAQQTIDSLKAGKHVVCEKPGAFTMQESRAIINAAKKAGKKAIFTPARMRYGAAGAAKDYIKQGKLGKIYKVEVKYFRDRGRPGLDVLPEARWFLNKKLAGGGVTPDMGQYFMDMVFNLTGWPKIKTVSGVTFKGFPFKLPKNVIYNVEEHCSMFIRTEKDINFSFEFANIAMHKAFRKITIMGTKGGIIMDDENYFQYITEKAPGHQVVEKKSSGLSRRRSNDFIYADLLKAINGKKTDVGSTPEQNHILIQVNLMAYLSAKRGKEVTPADIKDYSLAD